MLAQDQTFPFVVPNPATVAARRSVVVGLVIATCLFVYEYLSGTLSTAFFPIAEFIVVGGAILVLVSFSSNGSVVVTPNGLVMRRWRTSRSAPWSKVASVALTTIEPTNWLSALYTKIAYGQDGSTPFVDIALRRAPLNLLGRRVWVVYLQEPEKFVQKAQQYLTPVAG